MMLKVPRRRVDTGPTRADYVRPGGERNPVAHGTDHDLADRDVILGLTLQQADAVIRRTDPRAAEGMVERIVARRRHAQARLAPLTSPTSEPVPATTTTPDANAPRQERRAHPRTVTVTGVR
jgi:hypothetical protein